MYNDTIKVANKIISDTDLEEIFNKMNEEMQMCEKQCQIEKQQNEKYEREYQNWTVKDYTGSIHATVNFYDDTRISFDNFTNFISIFNSRLHEIRNIYIRYSSTYSRRAQGEQDDWISQNITLDIYENKMDIDVKLDSKDNIMNQIYDTIKEKILSAPEKYDRIIKKKSTIQYKVGFAIGAIPSVILLTLLAFVPVVRQIYAMTYVVYPIACLLFAFMIGNTFCLGKLNHLYQKIVPEKRYAGYDKKSYQSIYKDDVDSYIQTSEIIIGKNIDNLKNRNEIKEIEQKYSKLIPKELIVIAIISIIVVIIEHIIQL